MPTSVQAATKQAGEDPQALVGVRGDATATGHAERDDLRDVQLLAGEQLEELLLLWIGRGEPGLDHVHAERVERINHAQLLVRGEAHAASAHAVAQGGVV